MPCAIFGRGPLRSFLPLTFPLSIAPSGRFLVTASGAPFLIVGDTMQRLVNQLTLANIGVYFANRVAKGFNSILIELSSLLRGFDSAGTPAAPRDKAGNLPFLLNNSGGTYDGSIGTAAFNSPNPAYWASVDAAIDSAAGFGLQLLIYPLAWGYGLDGTQGWWPDLMNATNTRAVCSAFGAYLAGRYAGKQNVWWLHGSDSFGNNTGTPESGIGRAHALMTGLIAGGCTQLRSGDWASPSESTDGPSDIVSFPNYMQLNGTYSIGGSFATSGDTTLQTYLEARRGYNFVPTVNTQGPGSVPAAIPTYLKEAQYKSSPLAAGTDADLRKSQIWAVLSGCTAGFFYGNTANVDNFNIATWSTTLDDSSAVDAGRFATFMRSISWQLLVPSELGGMRRLITTSNGVQSVGATYVAAACASNGSCLVAYAATQGGGGTQTFSVDLRSMAAGTLTCTWFDPSTGATQSAGTATNAASAQSFTTPGNNADPATGKNDWLLKVVAP